MAGKVVKPAQFNLSTIDKLEKLRERFPYAEDRSTKAAYLSARCSYQLREDFDYVARVIEGEEPAIVLRRLVREYIHAMLKDD